MPKDNISFEYFDPDLELGRILDEHGKPIRPRKKPGRKPNPPSPAQRKAQNRAAQRAFRERKRREMNEAEVTVKSCLESRNEALEQVKELTKRLQEVEQENRYLKGYVLSIKLTCFTHQIKLPQIWDSQFKESIQPLDYFLDKDMSIIRMDQPHPILVSQSSPFSIPSQSPLSPFSSSSSHTSSDACSDLNINQDVYPQKTSNEDFFEGQPLSTIAPTLASHLKTPFFQQLLQTGLANNVQEKSPKPPRISTIPISANQTSVIQSQTHKPTHSFIPTELQKYVPHDKRIDMVPSATLRDHMILFQDFYNANDLFETLNEHSLFSPNGLNAQVIPRDVFMVYWFLFPADHLNHPEFSIDIKNLNRSMIIESMKKRRLMYYDKEIYCENFPSYENQYIEEPNTTQPDPLDTHLFMQHLNHSRENMDYLLGPQAEMGYYFKQDRIQKMNGYESFDLSVNHLWQF